VRGKCRKLALQFKKRCLRGITIFSTCRLVSSYATAASLTPLVRFPSYYFMKNRNKSTLMFLHHPDICSKYSPQPPVSHAVTLCSPPGTREQHSLSLTLRNNGDKAQHRCFQLFGIGNASDECLPERTLREEGV
jgi:hypothetical protein